MPEPQAPPDIYAGKPILIALGCLGTLVALTLVVGGIYLATADKFADTTMRLFGTELESTSIGVSMAFLGAIVTIVVFRSILKALRHLASLR